MKSLNSMALRWRAIQLAEQMGRIPLAISALPICLLGLWLGCIAPQTQQQQAELVALQQQLRPALPLAQQPALQQALSPHSWQQVKMIFDQLEHQQLQVETSRYQLIKQQDGAEILQLDIPLKGEYMPLMQVLESLSRSLPLQIVHLDLKRPSPRVARLSATLQLQLKKGTP